MKDLFKVTVKIDNGLRIRAVFSMASYTLLVADCKTFLSVGKR